MESAHIVFSRVKVLVGEVMDVEPTWVTDKPMPSPKTTLSWPSYFE